jgi:SAM-dependent methyltransferase
MVDVIRYHQISESTHRIMNPLSAGKLLLVAEICRVGRGTRLLDLACGKGELLCQFASRFGASGVGVDIHPPFLEGAKQRAAELGVAATVRFVEGDAGEVRHFDEQFDLVSCIGATWIGGGLAGTLELMRRWVAPGGWLLVGDVYWTEPAPVEVKRRYGPEELFADLAGTLDRFDAAGLDLVEMVLANDDDWDRYRASQWLNVSDWLAANPDDPDAAAVRDRRDASRRSYLSDERRCLGWGVFALRVAS